MINQISHISRGRREAGTRMIRDIYIAEAYIRVPVGVVKDGGFTSYIGKREVVNHAACFESNFFQTVPSYSF